MATTVIMRGAPAHLIDSFAPKPTATTEGLVEGSAELWEGMKGQPGIVETGIWEATPGTFTATRVGYHEICYLVSGRVSLIEDGAEAVEFQAGDLFVTPEGWRGTWVVHETVRKVYVVVTV